MMRRWERRRRLLLAGVLLGLVVIVAVLTVVDAALRAYDSVSSGFRRRSKRKETALFRIGRLAMPARISTSVVGEGG